MDHQGHDHSKEMTYCGQSSSNWDCEGYQNMFSADPKDLDCGMARNTAGMPHRARHSVMKLGDLHPSAPTTLPIVVQAIIVQPCVSMSIEALHGSTLTTDQDGDEDGKRQRKSPAEGRRKWCKGGRRDYYAWRPGRRVKEQCPDGWLMVRFGSWACCCSCEDGV